METDLRAANSQLVSLLTSPPLLSLGCCNLQIYLHFYSSSMYVVFTKLWSPSASPFFQTDAIISPPPHLLTHTYYPPCPLCNNSCTFCSLIMPCSTLCRCHLEMLTLRHDPPFLPKHAARQAGMRADSEAKALRGALETARRETQAHEAAAQHAHRQLIELQHRTALRPQQPSVLAEVREPVPFDLACDIMRFTAASVKRSCIYHAVSQD